MPDYWEDHLTVRLFKAQENELRIRPPSEYFLAAYFEGQNWWHPPRGADDSDTEVLPESTLPEFEE